MTDTLIDRVLPDLSGEYYIKTLERLHSALQPKTYFEIGVFNGQSLSLAKCKSIAVDPNFQIAPEYLSAVIGKPQTHLYQTGSDNFFADYSPAEVLGAPIDMAFLDGMHRCEYLLRDFINTERHCKPNSIIALHDCLPVEVGMTTRDQSLTHTATPHRTGWWTGDVWRTSLLLRRSRPDLHMTALDCEPTGLMLITNLDPESTSLTKSYGDLVRSMLSWDLEQISVAGLFSEMRVQSASTLYSHEQITSKFWL